MTTMINTNVMSLNSQRNLANNSASLATTIQRLSSGLRINSARDDAAGLAISERFSTQIRGMNVAVRNANDGISLAQTAEGAMGEIGNNLQRIRELAVQSRNATNSASDRAALNAEAQQLKSEISRVASQTEFNGLKLLDGSFTAQAFQVGANSGQTITVSSITNANIAQLGSWTAADSAASASGVAPVGTAAPVPATLAMGTLTGGSGGNVFDRFGMTFTAGSDTLSLEVFGAIGSADAAGVASEFQFAGFQADGSGTVSGFSLDLGGQATIENAVTAGTLSVRRADGVDFTYSESIYDVMSQPVGLTGTTFATAAAAGGSSDGDPTAVSFGAGSFTLNGQTISLGAVADAATRLSDLVSVINGADAGVTASTVAGALVLTSSDNTSDIVIGGASLGFNLTEQTGLNAATTNPAAGTLQTGFAALDISTAAGADDAIKAMDGALDAINSARADMGAVQNRFQSVIQNLQTTSENLSASRSRIRDTDFAKETAELARTQILAQAGTAMLAQANQATQNVLSLLR